MFGTAPEAETVQKVDSSGRNIANVSFFYLPVQFSK